MSEVYRGRAFVYELEHSDKSKEFVVSSAVYNIMSGPETTVFPSSVDGFITDWNDLNRIHELDPDKAVRELGFEIDSEPLGQFSLDAGIPCFIDSVKPGNLIQFLVPRLQMRVFEGRWNPENIKISSDNFDFFSQIDKIDSGFYLLLSQPTLEQNFNVFIFEILNSSKVMTVLIEKRLSEKDMFRVVKSV